MRSGCGGNQSDPKKKPAKAGFFFGIGNRESGIGNRESGIGNRRGGNRRGGNRRGGNRRSGVSLLLYLFPIPNSRFPALKASD
ncbi:hypothetical protein XacyCFBP1159_05550 [Xanthomonas arboricola pv. corylina]|nr:hypothetical protein XacyCFBP1159_05550 [Xanthomonas arboricola pv. corylina]